MPESAPTLWRRLRPVVLVAVSVGLLLWTVSKVDGVALKALAGQMRWPYLLAAAVLAPLQVWLSAQRWRGVSAALGLSLPLRRAFSELYLATLLNQVLPSGVAGDGVRVLRHGRDAGALRGALHAAVVERYAGQLVLGLASLLAVWVLDGALAPGLGWAVLAVFGALVAVGLLPQRVPVLGPFARDARRGLGATLSRSAALSAALLLSYLAAMSLCALGLGVTLSLPLIAGFVLVLLAMAVPLSVGGWGLREAAATALLPTLGVPAESALAISVAYGLSVLVGSLPGALVPWVEVSA